MSTRCTKAGYRWLGLRLASLSWFGLQGRLANGSETGTLPPFGLLFMVGKFDEIREAIGFGRDSGFYGLRDLGTQGLEVIRLKGLFRVCLCWLPRGLLSSRKGRNACGSPVFHSKPQTLNPKPRTYGPCTVDFFWLNPKPQAPKPKP